MKKPEKSDFLLVEHRGFEPQVICTFSLFMHVEKTRKYGIFQFHVEQLPFCSYVCFGMFWYV